MVAQVALGDKCALLIMCSSSCKVWQQILNTTLRALWFSRSKICLWMPVTKHASARLGNAYNNWNVRMVHVQNWWANLGIIKRHCVAAEYLQVLMCNKNKRIDGRPIRKGGCELMVILKKVSYNNKLYGSTHKPPVKFATRWGVIGVVCTFE